MHLQHHAYHLPKEHRYGVNFGMTLSVWDYIFGTAYVPETDGNLVIGYPNDKKMPTSFIKQSIHGFTKS
jgi:sterol desaturase/sphingolipid hydroxylase (fatty acid hydroxylase superfamily)